MDILAAVEGVCDTPLRFLADKEKRSIGMYLQECYWGVMSM